VVLSSPRQREPGRALRILTTRAGSVRRRIVSAVEAARQQEIAAGQPGPPLPVHDLAFLLVRIA
jgi:Tetracyclin repressor-like, C-terminal domain